MIISLNWQSGKGIELVNSMIRRKTKWTRGKSKDIENAWYRLWFTRKDKHGNETRIIVEKIERKHYRYNRLGGRIIL